MGTSDTMGDKEDSSSSDSSDSDSSQSSSSESSEREQSQHKMDGGHMNQGQHGEISEGKAVEDSSINAQLSESGHSAVYVASTMITLFVVAVVLLGLYCFCNTSSKYHQYRANKKFKYVGDDEIDLDEMD